MTRSIGACYHSSLEDVFLLYQRLSADYDVIIFFEETTATTVLADTPPDCGRPAPNRLMNR
jgi:erythromycin esterase-like protein